MKEMPVDGKEKGKNPMGKNLSPFLGNLLD